MGSNLGWTPIDVEFPCANPVVLSRIREIIYVRYVDWWLSSLETFLYVLIERVILVGLMLMLCQCSLIW